MPEGPECKLLADGLHKKFKGVTLTNIEIYAGRYKTHGPFKNYNKLIEELPLKIKSVNAYGKFIWFEFENSNLTLWNTLGMTGWFQMEEDKHNNVGLHYTKNGKNKILYFNDYRNFGTFMADTKENLDKKLKTFGLDILDKKDNTELFLKLVKKSKKTICEILLNQKIVAGSGNYLRADALYLAKMNPFLKPKEISDDNLKTLYSCLRQLAWYHYDEDQGKKLGIIKKNINFNLITDRIFFVYSQKKDIQGFDVYRKDINGRTIHYSTTQVE
jgi:formamidopyrimidine-DNA glycosylase